MIPTHHVGNIYYELITICQCVQKYIYHTDLQADDIVEQVEKCVQHALSQIIEREMKAMFDDLWSVSTQFAFLCHSNELIY